MRQTSSCTRDEQEDDEETIALDGPRVLNDMDCTYWIPLSRSGRNLTVVEGNGSYNRSNATISWFARWTIANWEDGSHTELIHFPLFITKVLKHDDSTGSDEIHLSDEEVIPSSFATMAFIKGVPSTGAASIGYISTADLCAFSICAREYNVSMTSGFLRSEIVSTSYGDVKGVDEALAEGSMSYAFTFPNNPGNDFTFFPSKKLIRDEFILDGKRMAWAPIEWTLQEAMQGVFNDDLVLNGDGDVWTEYQSPTASFLQGGLNASVSIPKTMDRVAAAMTNHLRDRSNITIQGLSGSIEVYIRVSGLWLLLPVISTLLGTALLASVIVVTRRRKLPAWKASELALLFHGLDFPLNDTIDMH